MTQLSHLFFVSRVLKFVKVKCTTTSGNFCTISILPYLMRNGMCTEIVVVSNSLNDQSPCKRLITLMTPSSGIFIAHATNQEHDMNELEKTALGKTHHQTYEHRYIYIYIHIYTYIYIYIYLYLYLYLYL